MANGNHIKQWPLRVAGLSLLALALLAWPRQTAAGEDGDVCFVTKTDVLPNKEVSAGDLTRIKPLLDKLAPEGKLRLEFTTVSRAVTNYDHDVRYVRRVTSLNAKGQPDGMEVDYADWHRNSIRSATYKAGVLDGFERQFDPETGTLLAEVPWVKGKIHGAKRTFHASGKLANETVYEQGVVTGASRSFTADGNPLRVVEFRDGVRDGTMTEYWLEKPEVVKQIVPYRKGVVEGLAKAFYLNGKLKWERPFRDNRQHGIEKQYDTDGKVEKTLYWLNGDQVSAEEYAKKAKP